MKRYFRYRVKQDVTPDLDRLKEKVARHTERYAEANGIDKYTVSDLKLSDRPPVEDPLDGGKFVAYEAVLTWEPN